MSDNNTTTPTATGVNPPNASAEAPHAIAGGAGDAIEADVFTDDDASVAGESLASSTSSIASSIFEYRMENGRTYHKYKDGKYWIPNDERENDRLDLEHNLCIRTFDGQLGTAPPNEPGSKVGRVLDVGTGTGIWAIDFGDEHPEADVVGVDLSPSQPDFVPPNVRFEVDDVEEPWTFSKPFDYIHSRMLNGSIRDWETFLQSCYDNLSPGGYLELNDVDGIPTSDDGTLTKGSIMKAFNLVFEALAIIGSPFEDFNRLEGVLSEIGFQDIRVQRFKWPTNNWPKDPKLKELGLWNYQNLAPNCDGLLMAPLTRALGWTEEEVHILSMEVRKDLANRNIHAYYNVWSIHGRKPLKDK